MLDDLRRQHEIDSFYGKSMDWPQALALIAFVFVAAWAVDRIERRAAINAAPQERPSSDERTGSAVTGQVHPADAAPLSHPLRGDGCDITITQRGAGKWEPERCAKGVRK